MLEIKNLIKKHSEEFSLGPISIDLSGGQCLALIGKNGAGKSTLFQLITGHSDATSGQVHFKNQRVSPSDYQIKRQMGYLPQELGLPEWNTAYELLNYTASLHNIENTHDNIAKLLEYWDIDYYQHRPLASCSHGMKKRVGIAVATVHQPDLLILDEPFAGLDLDHTSSLHKLIKDRSRDGKITILSTHVIPYAAKLCKQAIIISAGSFVETLNLADKQWYEASEEIEKKFFEITKCL